MMEDAGFAGIPGVQWQWEQRKDHVSSALTTLAQTTLGAGVT